jgi:hypothetical protein
MLIRITEDPCDIRKYRQTDRQTVHTAPLCLFLAHEPRIDQTQQPQHCSDGIYMHTEENHAAECEAFETGSTSATTMMIKQTSHRFHHCETVNIPPVLHRCEIGSLQIMEEHGLRPFESKVLRRIFGSKREDGGNIRMRSFILCTPRQILLMQ